MWKNPNEIVFEELKRHTRYPFKFEREWPKNNSLNDKHYDIAVIDKKNKFYLLIELDSATFHSSFEALNNDAFKDVLAEDFAYYLLRSDTQIAQEQPHLIIAFVGAIYKGHFVQDTLVRELIGPGLAQKLFEHLTSAKCPYAKLDPKFAHRLEVIQKNLEFREVVREILKPYFAKKKNYS